MTSTDLVNHLKLVIKCIRDDCLLLDHNYYPTVCLTLLQFAALFNFQIWENNSTTITLLTLINSRI